MNKASIVKFLETFSILGFGVAYWRYDLIVATQVLIGLMTLHMAAATVLKVPLNKLQKGTWLVVVLLGGATLLSQDEGFIKWKTTVINGVLASIFVLSHVIGKKTIVERLLHSVMDAPRVKLRRVNFAAVLYFSAVAALNWLFAMHFDTTTWVQFKIFGVLALNMAFLGGVFYYLRAHLKELINALERRS